MRVLIVDDDYVSRTKLKALLSAYGDCDEAPDGEAAFKLFVAAYQEGAPYDLVTMDVDMPGLSGQETVHRLREFETQQQSYKHCRESKILMVSVKMDPQEIVASFREGCEWYLIKPVTPQNLRASLARLGLQQRVPAD